MEIYQGRNISMLGSARPLRKEREFLPWYFNSPGTSTYVVVPTNIFLGVQPTADAIHDSFIHRSPIDRWTIDNQQIINKMPSSLMARLKATQGSDPTPAKGGRSHVVTPPPPPSSLSSRSRPSSSLAAAAASVSSSSSAVRVGITDAPAKSSSYVPQFRKNPLNADVSKSHETSFITTPTADETHNNATPSSLSSPKTLIQQLSQRKNEPPPIPSPFCMCPKSEALDRQQHLELSPFECNAGTLGSGLISTLSPSTTNDGKMATVQSQPTRWGAPASQKAARHRPTFNPRYVIKKYRRSAAGGGALYETSDRSLDQLNKTVDYLLGHIVVNKRPPPTAESDMNNNDDTVNSDPNEIQLWGEDDNSPVEKQAQEIDHTPFSFADTVSFIDDRLRAVQKDLVTLLGNALKEPNNGPSLDINSASAKRNRVKLLRMKQTAREMQAKMVRYNILASYLLSDVPPSKYELKFGARALRTSLTSYLDLSTSLHEQYRSMPNSGSTHLQSQYRKEHKTQDEIMAYMALLHSSAVLRSEEKALPPPTSGEFTSSLMDDAGSGWGALLSTFRTRVLDGEGAATGTSERWKWALELACSAQEGNYQRYFSLLEGGPALSSASNDTGEAVEANDARFLILARCIASHSLSLVRLGQIRRYNRAFGKGENVPAKDLARLLRLNGNGGDKKGDEIMDGAKRAINFCQDAGLPVVEREVGNQKELFITMKSAPIKISGEMCIWRICHPGRTNDSFVFGSNLVVDGDGSSAVDLLANQHVDDWEERDAYSKNGKNKKSTAGETGLNAKDVGTRNDQDGVLIPPSNVMRNLIS